MRNLPFRFSAKCGRAFLLLILVLPWLVACGPDKVYGDEVELEGEVVVDCGQDCRDHGSCGRVEETGQDVIMVGGEPAFPGVSSVEFRGLEEGSLVQVLSRRVVDGVEQRTGKEVQIRFYLVESESGRTIGWVPGFCVTAPSE